MSNQSIALIPAAQIERKIFLLRGEKVSHDDGQAAEFGGAKAKKI